VDRSQLFRLLQEKIDTEIGNRMTGELAFRIKMLEGGIRRCDSQTTQVLGVKAEQHGLIK